MVYCPRISSWFGSWRASSLNAAISRKYRVVIRDLRERSNYCSCPDFAGNQLGTCKHIEAALHKIRKHPEYETFRTVTASLSLCLPQLEA